MSWGSKGSCLHDMQATLSCADQAVIIICEDVRQAR